jgi:hypothetical protein
MWEGTSLRIMAAERSYGEFYYLCCISAEYFGYHLVWFNKDIHSRNATSLEFNNLSCKNSVAHATFLSFLRHK